jgi:hypothetical protein
MHTEQEKKQGSTMSTTSAELDQLIHGAIKKIGGRKENDLCRYLPMITGGYMHHFTLRKMKHQGPERLAEMIRRFILDTEKPLTVKPKQRAARGSRKKKGQVVLNDTDIEYLLTLARSVGNKEMVRKLLPHKELKVVKRELIASIRNGRVDNNLWNTYIEAVTN